MRAAMLTLLTTTLMLGAPSLHAENLLQVYQLAQQGDPVLRAAEASYRAGLEAKPQGRAGLLPVISADANWNSIEGEVNKPLASAGTFDYDTHNWSVSLSQPLFRWDRWAQLKQADAQVAQAEAGYRAAQQATVLRVAEAYFNILSARDGLEFAQAEEKAVAQQLRQTEQRFEVGLSAITDVHEARARYDATIAQAIAARNALDVAHESLHEITGQVVGPLAALTDAMPLLSPTPSSVEQWTEQALQYNLNILASSAAVGVQQREVEKRRAGHYPTLDLVASHQYSDQLEAGGNESDTDSVSLQLSVPLFSGGGTQSRVRQATQLKNKAQQELEQARRAAVRQTRSAYLNVVAGISQVKAREQALSSAQTALEATRAGFEVGTRTAVDVLDAQQNRYSVQRDYARARYDYLLATLRLKQAAGILSEEDVAQINSWLE